MRTYKLKTIIRKRLVFALLPVVLLTACTNNGPEAGNSAPTALNQVSAVQLNYRFEADVPAPPLKTAANLADRNEAVQADFDTNRAQEILDRTIASPDQKYIAAVYYMIGDAPSEYRLDMYSANGIVLRKLTSESMAVRFPDTIVWSPDSNSIAFVAALRATRPLPDSPGVTTADPRPPVSSPTPVSDEDAVDPEAPELREEVPVAPAAPTPEMPRGVLAFRTEQIYIAAADGTGVRPLTMNEGLIYFYYRWSPDSNMLVALASTSREWRYQQIITASKEEMMVPQGRPRIIEKNGRERRLDDNPTTVQPVWSPDSTKVAVALGNQIRIYDAAATNPTQAAVPLRNQLLISSQAYDRAQKRALQIAEADANIDANTAATPEPDEPLSTLPDERLLVSYNPIVELSWTADNLIYLKTAYLRRMKNEAESVMSFARWHRLALSVQAVPAQK